MKGVQLNEVLEAEFDGQKLVGFSVGGLRLPDNDIRQLISEAELISNSTLWQLLVKRAMFVAQLQACDNAKDFGDVRESRGTIRTLKLFEDILQILKSFEKVAVEKKDKV